MTTTSNFEITHLDPQQSGKEATINDAWNRIDDRMSGMLVHNMTADADYSLDTTNPAYEHQNYLIRITDTGVLLTTTRVIQFPANLGPYAFHNLTAQTLQARVGGAGGLVNLGTGTVNGIYSDGTDMILRAGAGGSPSTSAPYDFTMFFGGIPTPTATNELLRIPFTRAVDFPINLPNSKGEAKVSASASTTFTFKKNGVAFATANFAIAATSATFVCASTTSFVAGDIFTCDAPGSADASLSNVGFSLATTRL